MSDRMKFIESSLPEGVRAQVRRFTSKEEYITKCDVIDNDNNEILCSGKSRCHPNDSPNRKIGRAIAVGRAVRNFFGGQRTEENV